MGSNTRWVSWEMGASAGMQRGVTGEALFYFHPEGRCSPGSEVTAGSHKTYVLYPETDNMLGRTGVSDWWL